jgi:hypothetical protein
VLANQGVCDLLLSLAERPRLFVPHWSAKILEEVRRTHREKLGWPEHLVDLFQREVTASFPEAEITGFAQLIPTLNNHEKDRHVLAAAIVGACPLILTFNLKHFDALHLQGHGIKAVHPEGYLVTLYELEPAQVMAVLGEIAGRRRLETEDLLRRWAPASQQRDDGHRSPFSCLHGESDTARLLPCPSRLRMKSGHTRSQARMGDEDVAAPTLGRGSDVFIAMGRGFRTGRRGRRRPGSGVWAMRRVGARPCVAERAPFTRHQIQRACRILIIEIEVGRETAFIPGQPSQPGPPVARVLLTGMFAKTVSVAAPEPSSIRNISTAKSFVLPKLKPEGSGDRSKAPGAAGLPGKLSTVSARRTAGKSKAVSSANSAAGLGRGIINLMAFMGSAFVGSGHVCRHGDPQQRSNIILQDQHRAAAGSFDL